MARKKKPKQEEKKPEDPTPESEPTGDLPESEPEGTSLEPPAAEPPAAEVRLSADTEEAGPPEPEPVEAEPEPVEAEPEPEPEPAKVEPRRRMVRARPPDPPSLEKKAKEILKALAKYQTTGANGRMISAETGIPLDDCHRILAALAQGQGERKPYTRAYGGKYTLTPAGATAALHTRHADNS